MYIVPIDNTPNHSFTCLIPVDNANRTFYLKLMYNNVADYWEMDVGDADTGESLICGMPLLSGEYPAANLLEPWTALSIGSAVIVPIGTATSSSNPNLESLGASYALVWSDTNE